MGFDSSPCIAQAAGRFRGGDSSVRRKQGDAIEGCQQAKLYWKQYLKEQHNG
jgi:hypothetical protein